MPYKHGDIVMFSNGSLYLLTHQRDKWFYVTIREQDSIKYPMGCSHHYEKAREAQIFLDTVLVGNLVDIFDNPNLQEVLNGKRT